MKTSVWITTNVTYDGIRKNSEAVSYFQEFAGDEEHFSVSIVFFVIGRVN